MSGKASVLAWLRQHPDLFCEHPELLAEMKLPHQAGTTSLLEFQAERLRDRNAELGRKLRELTRIATENEQLMRRLHGLSLILMASPSSTLMLETLGQRLREDFRADQVELHLIKAAPELIGTAQAHDHSEARPDWFDRLLESGEIRCGRLTREKTTLLFPGDSAEAPATIGSAALVPIADIGLLAIGAASDERFHPGMGTLFLELLAETLRSRLEGLAEPLRRRA